MYFFLYKFVSLLRKPVYQILELDEKASKYFSLQNIFQIKFLCVQLRLISESKRSLTFRVNLKDQKNPRIAIAQIARSGATVCITEAFYKKKLDFRNRNQPMVGDKNFNLRIVFAYVCAFWLPVGYHSNSHFLLYRQFPKEGRSLIGNKAVFLCFLLIYA